MKLRLGPGAVHDASFRAVIVADPGHRAPVGVDVPDARADVDAVLVGVDAVARSVRSGPPPVVRVADAHGVAAVARAGGRVVVVDARVDRADGAVSRAARDAGLTVLVDDRLDRLDPSDASARLRHGGPADPLLVVTTAPDWSLADRCGLLALALTTGRRIVISEDPATARRVADLVETLERERSGVCP